MTAKTILAASVSCFASLLACTVARAATPVPTQTETFTGTYNPTKAQSSGYLVYGSNLPAALGGTFLAGSQNLFTSEPANFASTVGPVTIQVPVGATNLRGAVFSVYDLNAGGVTLTLSTTFAATVLAMATAPQFSDVFTTAGYNNEATFLQNLTLAEAGNSTNVTYIQQFFTTYQNDFSSVVGNSASATLVNFSAATPGGSAALNFTPTPEPATWALLVSGLGVGAFVVRRRGSQKSNSSDTRSSSR